MMEVGTKYSGERTNGNVWVVELMIKVAWGIHGNDLNLMMSRKIKEVYNGV